MARFLTTEDIDLKPDAYVPLDLIYKEPKFQSNIIHGLATRGPKMKNTKSAIASLLLNRFLGNFNIMFLLWMASAERILVPI